MHRTTALALILAILPGLGGPAAAQQPAGRPFELADWYRLVTVSAPAMSPGGDQVAFTVTTVREAENKRHNEVWVAPVSGGEPQRFTSPGTESSAPHWSPDGHYLLFTSTRPGGTGGASSAGSTWAIRMDRPGGEAIQREQFHKGSVSRDGRLLVWTDADTMPVDSAALRKDPFFKMPPMAHPPYGAITRPADPGRFDGRQVVDLRYKSNDRGFIPGPREARRWPASQIWVQDSGSGVKRVVLSSGYSMRNAVVSPSGRWVAFLADPELRRDSVVEHERDSLSYLPYDAKRDEATRNESDIFIVSVKGGTPRRVAQWTGAESDLTWSPDDARLAFIGRATRTSSARVYLVDAAGSAPRQVLGDDFRYEPNGLDWLPDGTLLFNADVGGSSGLYRLDTSSRVATQLLGGRRKLTGFSIDAAGRRMAYVATSMTKPTELFVADVDGRNERQVTHFNDKLSRDVAFSDADRFTYQSVGGTEIEGWLMKPYGWQPGKRYPLVLYVHGGPHAQYGESWFDEFQNLAAQGMFVLFTNPRGSSGYGADFTYASRGDWGGRDFQDLMLATDIAAKRTDVDSLRMGVTGGSYGGFMTAWITTKTRRFRAAETDRMISDWTYWYGASDAQGLTEFEFYGKPWDNPAMYDTLSPIRYVSRVRTPTLMVQSEEDFRTPMGNAELWYMALRKQNVPVELVRYPRSTHELSRSGEPWLLVDRLGRIRQWFSYWLAK